MKYKKRSFFLLFAVTASVIIYAVAIIYIISPVENFSIANIGAFGDSFGVLTSLFSGLAFAGLIITIVQQKEELSLQREELVLTRNELAGQKVEFSQQNQTLKLQRFENTFFQLVTLHNQNVESLSYRSKKSHIDYEGRECFESFIEDIGLDRISELSKDGEKRTLTIPDLYDVSYQVISSKIEHYHKTLYQILYFIKRNDDIPDKMVYSNFIRAQMSKNELELLYYHCLSSFGKNKFKSLTEEFEFFEHLKFNHRVKKCMMFYNKKAFGKSETLLEKYKDFS